MGRIMTKPKQVTLSNLEQSSAQEVFDWVAYNLLKQNQVSKIVYPGDHRSFCAYRGDNGNKCAAGWLMSDDEYKPEFEQHSWLTLSYRKIVPDAHLRLVRSLQDIHDGTPPRKWKCGLSNLANDRGFDQNIVEEFK